MKNILMKIREILMKIRGLKNTLKLLLSYILLNILMSEGFFDIERFRLFSTKTVYGEGGITIDGLNFNEDTLLFGCILLFIYWIFWGFKKIINI